MISGIKKSAPCKFSPYMPYLNLLLITTSALALSLIVISAAFAAQILLVWDPSSDLNVIGYKIYCGTDSKDYGPPEDVGNRITWTLGGLIDGQTYYIAIKAYDSSGAESSFSNEVSGKASNHARIVWRNPISGQNAIWNMRGVTVTSIVDLPGVSNAAYTIAGLGDFNGDGEPDILWRNSTTGANAVWYMKGGMVTAVVALPGLSPPWSIVGIGDFNADGKPDIIWRNTTTGANAIWYMKGATFSSAVDLPGVSNTAYTIVGVGDFNGDGKPDIIWRNTTTGANAVWYMNGAAVSGVSNLPSHSNTAYAIVGVGDFNGDGKADIIWRNSTTGQNAVWYLDGVTFNGVADLPGLSSPWAIVGR